MLGWLRRSDLEEHHTYEAARLIALAPTLADEVAAMFAAVGVVWEPPTPDDTSEPPPPDFHATFRARQAAEMTRWLGTALDDLCAWFPREGAALARRLAESCRPDLATRLRDLAARAEGTPSDTRDPASLDQAWGAWSHAAHREWLPWRLVPRPEAVALLDAHATWTQQRLRELSEGRAADTE